LDPLIKTVIIGAINWDVTLFIPRFPEKGGEVVVRRISRGPGGKAGNVAVAASRLLGARKVAILGALGRDQIAKEHAKIFRAEGVEISGLKSSPDAESGQAYILVDDSGENAIHTHPGANATMTPEDIDSPVRRSLLNQSMVVTIMDPPFDTALKVAREAKRLGKIVAWDPGVKSELGLARAAGLLELLDYVVANEFETKYLTGTASHQSAAERLREINESLKVITKLGSKGAILYDGKQRHIVGPLDLRTRGLKVINTVGCGDAFIGAFVAALSEGRHDLEALRWANCAGGLKAAKMETRGSPSRKILEKHLARA
jgi:ribokinase